MLSGRGSVADVGVYIYVMENPPRRNPKRKVAEPAANHSQANGDELLREAVAPVTSDDIREWTGWCELESEPVLVAHL